MGWKIAAVLWFLLECWLSHQSGKQSAEQSRRLAARSGANERRLRRDAHLLCFAILALLACLGFGPRALLFCAAWSALDELTKKGIEGRHCSPRDIRLNLLGAALGAAVWLVIQAVI